MCLSGMVLHKIRQEMACKPVIFSVKDRTTTGCVSDATPLLYINKWESFGSRIGSTVARLTHSSVSDDSWETQSRMLHEAKVCLTNYIKNQIKLGKNIGCPASEVVQNHWRMILECLDHGTEIGVAKPTHFLLPVIPFLHGFGRRRLGIEYLTEAHRQVVGIFKDWITFEEYVYAITL